MKATDYMAETLADVAFVSTNSICQGIQVSALWPTLFGEGAEIRFAYQSFKWANLAAKNAGVSVAIIGLTRRNGGTKQIFIANEDGVVRLSCAT
ncbi:DNA methyltransferase [Xanthomonas campestris]|uniref:DNA methyltransferase n=1 Tax=Xanthomonas campestris TaxID=339 RepID=UPI00223B8E3F